MKARSQTNKEHSRADAKEALIAAATKLFSDCGYAAVSTRDIAEAAGVNLGAIQYHFGSKASLFVASIRQMMDHGAGMKESLEACSECGCKESAAEQLCKFIFFFMDHQLHPTGPQACRVMYREIFTDTANDPEMFEALISSVSAEYVKPLEDLLVSVLRHIKPSASLSELEQSAQSVIGQCSHYITKRPFLERIRKGDFSKTPLFEQTGEHIAKFSLRALGCDDALIEKATKQVFHSGKSPPGVHA